MVKKKDLAQSAGTGRTATHLPRETYIYGMYVCHAIADTITCRKLLALVPKSSFNHICRGTMN